MPRYTAAHMWSVSNGANYKSSGQAVSDALKAVLTQTGDTGQVNWATVTTLPIANTVRDYEVYRFSDALQSTKPIFIRVDYMLHGGMRARFTVGTATDGAGAISGVTSLVRKDGHDYVSTATPLPDTGSSDATHGATSGLQLYASSDGSYLTLIHGHQTAVTGIAADSKMAGVAIDRTRNADGTANGEGFSLSFLAQNAYQGMTHRYTNGNPQPGEREFTLMTMIPNPAQTTTYVGDTALAYPVHGHSPMLQGASQAQLYVVRADYPRMTEVTVPHYGQNATWLPLGPMGSTVHGYTGPGNGAASSTVYGLIWRY